MIRKYLEVSYKFKKKAKNGYGIGKETEEERSQMLYVLG